MSTLILTPASSGAPTLNAVNGSLNAVLDWALVQNGWAIEYTATNARVYRAGVGSGNRRRVMVRHDSAISGAVHLVTVRGCEDATSATALVDPFPTVALYPDNAAVWMIGDTTTPSTARDWVLIVGTNFFSLLVRTSVLTDTSWTCGIFGDMPPSNSEDVWNTICTTRAAVGGTSLSVDPLAGQSSGSSLINASTNTLFWCRDITGTVKSTRGGWNTGGTYLSSCNGLPIARAGYANRIVREKIAVYCTGSSSTSAGATILVRRCWVPNWWSGIQSNFGALTSADTFTDSVYNASALFRPILNTSISGIYLETTDTWSMPVG